MATTKTYFISPNGNTIVTGQDLILDGTQQFHTDGTAKVVPTGKHKTIIINSVSPGSWASGDDFEITNLATNNTLNASFVGLGFTEVNPASFSGIQLVNLQLGEGNVVVDGGFGGNSLPLFNGITTLTLKASSGGFLTFGASSAPLEVLLTNIKAQNATATGSGIDVNLDPTLINPTTQAVTFSFSNVGNAGTHQFVSDDYVHGSRDVFAAGWGANDGSATAATWNLSVSGKAFVELFTHGATNTTAVNISNGTTASTGFTLFGVSDEFGNVANINDTASGAQVITGALQQDGASKSYTGFLADNTALPNGGSLSVTSTSSGDFVDLSGFSSLGTATISVAAGTVVLSDDVLLSGAPIVIGTPTNIGYGGDEGTGPGDHGTINWANLPSSANTLTFYHGVDANGTLSVVNTPNTFTMNLQDEGFHHNLFVVTAATPTAGNTFNLELGSNAGTIGVLGVTGGDPTDINENWTVTGYDTNNIILAGSHDVHLASEGGYFASSGVGNNTVDINIKGSLLDGTDVQEMHFGDITDGGSLFGYELVNDLAATAMSGVVTHGGTITDTATVFLELGVTDAAIINATSGHGLDMEDPGTAISATFTVDGSNNNFNNLQGSLGLVANILGVPIFNGNGGVFGFAGTSIITGGEVADHIWDTGGKETINVNNIHTKIFVDQFQLNSDKGPAGDDIAFAITDFKGNFDNNLGSGPKVATIDGFTPGATNSGWVDFNTDSWGSFLKYKGLTDGTGKAISGEGSHFASFAVIAGTGDTDNADVVAYEIGGPFGSADAVAASIVSKGGSFMNTLTAGNTYDLMVAYNNGSGGTNIADIQLKITTSGTTQGAIIENDADLAVLTGVGLGKIIGSVLGSNDVVHFNGA